MILGAQAEESIKLWENLIFDEFIKVGSLVHGGYSKGDSGTLRLIKGFCKSDSERGYEKSGCMVNFATFFKEILLQKIFLYTNFWEIGLT